jgi:hypothetical protein
VSLRRWDFISDHRADFGVKRICRVLGVSRAGYYRHLATAQARAERQAEVKRTVAEIRAIHGNTTAPTAPRASMPNSEPAGAGSTVSASPA